MASSKKALTSVRRKVSGASNSYPYGTCGNSVVGADSSVSCDVCDQWCHGRKACTALSEILIEKILKLGGSRIKLCCPRCETKGITASSDENNKQVKFLTEMVN